VVRPDHGLDGAHALDGGFSGAGLRALVSQRGCVWKLCHFVCGADHLACASMGTVPAGSARPAPGQADPALAPSRRMPRGSGRPALHQEGSRPPNQGCQGSGRLGHCQPHRQSRSTPCPRSSRAYWRPISGAWPAVTRWCASSDLEAQARP
jgi:hypothetical protein